MPGELHREVRRLMLDAGGYWRPLAEVARVLEELGELVEALEQGGAELEQELADLWIITAALADQYRIEAVVPSPPAPAGREGAAGALVAAGAIARVVNHYDGPKRPKSDSELPTLGRAIGEFHLELARIASLHQIDLAEAVRRKIALVRGRDMTRFEAAGPDPSTAAVLELAAAAGLEGRLWGAPVALPPGGTSGLAAASLPSLQAFVKAAAAESLDGYVIPLADGNAGAQELARALGLGGPGRGASLGGVDLEMETVPLPAPDAGTEALLLLRLRG